MSHLKLVAALCVLLAFVVVSDAAAPACLSPSGKVVSWWFIHKEKADDTSSYKTWGYADASTSYSYARSDDENSGKNALFTSQTAIFKAPHFLSYNDEPGPSTRAHEKGWIGWDDNSGTGSWIIHSVPLWNEDTDLPSHKYGQSFLCITLGSTDAVTSALQALLDTRVAVQGGCDGASHSSSANKMASSVCHIDDKSPRGGNTEPTLNQALGGGFFLFSKPPYANTDVWTLIAEAIGSKLLVSTWRRYNGDDDQFTKSVTDVECMSPDAIDKDATPACPSQGNDHGKYGISVGGDWVCVGGNNREVSQFKRGGLAVCFKNKGLHNKLSTLISAAGCASSSLTATVKGFASALGELISNAISEVLPTN